MAIMYRSMGTSASRVQLLARVLTVFGEERRRRMRSRAPEEALAGQVTRWPLFRLLA
jgi:hypothetical protein